MRKEFDKDELMRWYVDCFVCVWCGKWHADCFHHVVTDGDYTDSLLNAAPLFNFDCHIQIHSKLRKIENVKMLLEKVLSYLLGKGYQLNNTDKKFIEDHKQIYADILKNRNISL